MISPRRGTSQRERWHNRIAWNQLLRSCGTGTILRGSLAILLLVRILWASGVSTVKPEHPTPSDALPEAKPSSSGLQLNALKAAHSGSVVVLQEKDFTHNAINQTEFNFTYFDTKPSCDPLAPDQVSVTLTTQLSLDRMWIMKHQCQRWPAPHPISIAIYLPPSKTGLKGSKLIPQTETPESIVQHIEEELECDVARMTITILQGLEARNAEGDITPSPYPVNLLRNLAIQAATTTHVAYIDSDFLVSSELQAEVLSSVALLSNHTKTAIVMPAFEYLSNCTESPPKAAQACLQSQWHLMPDKYSDLPPLLDRRTLPKVRRGYQNYNGKNFYHSTTMYTTWLTDQTTTLPIPCRKSLAYEPYLVVRLCRDLPKFPQVFKGWGFNKVVWILILWKKLGYNLWQIPRGFLLHLPHEESLARVTTPKRPPEQQNYLDWMSTVPEHPNHLPKCVDWKKQMAERENKQQAAG